MTPTPETLASTVAHPALSVLPEERADELSRLLGEIAQLTREGLAWVHLGGKRSQWLAQEDLSVRRAAAREAAEHAGRTEVAEVSERAAWLTVSAAGGRVATANTATDAVLACVVSDLVSEEADRLREPWETGLALASWAEHADPGAQEIARALLPSWEGTTAALLEASGDAAWSL